MLPFVAPTDQKRNYVSTIICLTGFICNPNLNFCNINQDEFMYGTNDNKQVL